MKNMLELGFAPKEEARWLRSMAESLFALGQTSEARNTLREAMRRDPKLTNVKRLRKKLMI